MLAVIRESFGSEEKRMSQLTHDYSFPSVMREKLQAVRWRKAGLSAVRAVAVSGAVLLLLMIAAMSIDWIVTLFDTRVRIGLTVMTLASAMFVLLEPECALSSTP